jgi:hypothetical protein
MKNIIYTYNKNSFFNLIIVNIFFRIDSQYVCIYLLSMSNLVFNLMALLVNII